MNPTLPSSIYIWARLSSFPLGSSGQVAYMETHPQTTLAYPDLGFTTLIPYTYPTWDPKVYEMARGGPKSITQLSKIGFAKRLSIKHVIENFISVSSHGSTYLEKLYS